MRYRLIPALLAALCLAACGASSASSPTAPAPAGSTAVTIVSGASVLSTTAYSPDSISVPVGTTVSWLNSDNIIHTSNADNGAWTSSNIAPGARFNVTLTTVGTFQYHCLIHPNMVGTIVVH